MGNLSITCTSEEINSYRDIIREFWGDDILTIIDGIQKHPMTGKEFISNCTIVKCNRA